MDLLPQRGDVGAERVEGRCERLLIAAKSEGFGAVVQSALMGGNFAYRGGKLGILPRTPLIS